MPAPATAAELLELVQRSGVADDTKLRGHIQKLHDSGSFPNDPSQLAGILVRDGILTYFQAEQLLQGKYKRFSIGKYKVLEKLGAGGMAQVFLCEHKLMRRRVAIKVLPTAKAEDPSSLERFYREARAVAAVDHPNIVRAYDIDRDENLHFLVMEYVDGTNLQELVKKVGALDVLRACHYVYGASVGLQHAHEMGLVHRDIKPGNILVDRAGVVKILDMGLARFFHDDDDALTKKYDENVLGTADYLAPEQALDSHTVDIRADIYSLGATFYYLLTASAPFPEGSVAQKLIWHQNRQPRAVKSIRPEVPDPIAAVVERMMAKAPANRFQTPAEVMAALAPWVATPISPPAERELPQLSIAAGGGGGSGIAAGRGPATMIGPMVPHPGMLGTVAEHRGRADSPGAPGGDLSSGSDQGTVSPLVWESLDTEAAKDTLARGDTDRTRPQPPPRPRREAPSPARSRTLVYGISALLLVAASTAIYFAFFHKSEAPPPPPQAGPTGPRTITISRATGEQHFATLREGLSAANPGDTIVVAEPKLTEPLLRLSPTKHHDLTIVGQLPDGTAPVIAPSSPLSAMLELGSVEGVTIKNLALDGQGKVEVGIHISGLCPGVALESVAIRSVKQSALRLSNARGDPAHPIRLERVRATALPPGGVGLFLRAENVDTRYVQVVACRFEGDAKQLGIKVEGAADKVTVQGNRFFNLDTAMALSHVPTAKALRAQIISNTFYGGRVGIGFDTTTILPDQPSGQFQVTIEKNYFAKLQSVSAVTGISMPTGVRSDNNALGDGAVLGKGVVAAIPLLAPTLQNLDPNYDAAFLRFPAGPPELGPGKPKVGAP